MKDSHRHTKEKIPLNQALFWILLSTLLVSGTAAIGLLYYQYIKEIHGSDDAYRIVAIVQTVPENEGLKTVYLAELLDLSLDKPLNLYRFNTKEASRKLLSSPLIKEARVKKIRPGTIYVDYVLRNPIAFLADYSNTVIDGERYLFPYKPFFTPKRLPEIYLGVSLTDSSKESLWGAPVEGEYVELALSLLNYLQKKFGHEACQVKRIDVSKAYASSCGQREIILMLEDQVEQTVKGKTTRYLFPRILRLNTESYLQGLANYAVLQKHLLKQELSTLPANDKVLVKQSVKILDLRLSQLAFVANH
jgi:hypothetical protein